ncbi:MAG: 3-dehydroquinate synthase [Oscillospiraceae bacterium]|jgi:3-dehydroquinate synthase|nr:3-dehydroquinate synthase [Oscillospiraceae bacterium]
MGKIQVTTRAKDVRPYEIFIGSGLLEQTGSLVESLKRDKPDPASVVIVTDDIVNSLYSEKVSASLERAGFTVRVFAFPNGERGKTHETLLNLYAFLAEARVTRADLIIALGGGVVGDLAGYAAATFLRGIDYIQIPTTLLAQTDSSVGGKTGVNIEAGKNLAGAFYQPLLVICDTGTLSTLLPGTFSDGMAEIIKHGMIYDAELFGTADAGSVRPNNISDIIERSVRVKAGVVERDVHEKGERMKLNFGHTLGHAIEKYRGFSGITHGSAVAVGMSVITEISERLGLTEKGTHGKLKACLEKYNLPSSLDELGGVRPEMGELYKCCVNDKKHSGGAINVVLCDKIGSCFIKKMTADEFQEFLWT